MAVRLLHMVPMKCFIVKHTGQLARCAVAWLTLLLVGSAFADNSKISPDLLTLLTNPSNSVNVIVQYNSSLTSRGIIGGIINLLGDVVNATFSLIPAGIGHHDGGELPHPVLFFLNDTATAETYTLSLHDAHRRARARQPRRRPDAR